ncbi:MAG: hypothetical protein V7735_12035 [Photobacterium frigidiphilum]|uniref:hypothetical protein n=1 Tax=Photobacterium frigidiphilum TaxID=264736 RepID=UPI00300320BF
MMFSARLAKRVFTILLATGLIGCSTEPQTGDIINYKGVYTWGDGIRSFQPCGSANYYWVVQNSAIVEPMKALSITLQNARNESYQPVYVEITAEHVEQPKGGFAIDFNGAIDILESTIISENIPSECVFNN